MNPVVTRRAASALEARLMDWAKEWGGGKHRIESAGHSWLASMMKWRGRPPSGLGQVQADTPADQVQEAVEALEDQRNGRIPAYVLRAEYFSSAPKSEKLVRLARIGMRMDEPTFSRHLRIAKVHVAAWLKLPFDELMENDIEQEIAMLELLLDSEG